MPFGSLGLGLGLTGGRGRPYGSYALALDFKNGIYRASNGVGSLVTRSGYSYTRAGAKSELRPSGTPIAFAANEPGIVPGLGYWSRGILTNQLIRSQEFDNGVGWIPTGVSIAAVNDVAAPDGSLTADKLTGDGATSNHHLTSATSSFTMGNVYTASVFAKMGTHRYIQMTFGSGAFGAGQHANLDLQDGLAQATGGTATITALGNGWYRCVFTATAVGTASAPFAIGLATGLGMGRLATFAASGAAYLWQAQITAGSLPGPIIVTTGSSATVAADVLTISYTPPSEYSIVCRHRTDDIAALNRIAYSLDDATSNNRLQLGSNSTAVAGGHSVGGVFEALAISPALNHQGIRIDSAARYKTNDIALALNGIVRATDTSFLPPALNRLVVGADRVLGSHLQGYIEFIGIIPRALSDPELARITA